MNKVRVFNKFVNVPAPFHKDSDLGHEKYKVKIPKKSKLKASNITVGQFSQELTNHYNDEYDMNGIECSSSATWFIRRGYIFISVINTLNA